MNATLETTATTTEYVTFSTWQSVRKLANEIGVPFYSGQTYRHDKGMGLKHSNMFPNRINVEGYVSTYGDNDYMKRTVHQLSKEKFLLKMELWALKNNMEFTYVSEDRGWTRDSYIQISKKA